MFNLQKDKPHTIKLINYLQDSDPKRRVVVYYALAEYLIPDLIKDLNVSDIVGSASSIRASVKSLVYSINELAIIDASQLERIFNSVLDFKIAAITNVAAYNTNILQANCFQDILGVTRYYSVDDIHTINNNFELFKLVVGEVIQAIREEKIAKQNSGIAEEV